MNIRNLFLMSMIFCAASVVCAASSFAKATADKPEVTLTKQEQAIIKKWVQEINIKNQHPIVQEFGKFTISAMRDHFLAILDKMSLGKSMLALSSEIAVEREKLQLRMSNEGGQLLDKLIKKFTISERQNKMICEQVAPLMMTLTHFPLNTIFTAEYREECKAGEVVREINIAMMKKAIAIYSFIVTCL